MDREPARLSRRQRVRDWLLRYSIPLVSLGGIAALSVKPGLDTHEPVKHSPGTLVSYNLGLFGSLAMAHAARRLENHGRIGEMTAKGARAASAAGPLALQLALDAAAGPLTGSGRWPGLIYGLAGAASGTLTGRYFTETGLVDRFMDAAESTEPAAPDAPDQYESESPTTRIPLSLAQVRLPLEQPQSH